MTIKGSGGGGKGGGDARTPVEAPNTLTSVQYARLLDCVSEGEIGGLVSGLNSVLINDTPLLNKDGTANFNNVTVDYRLGTQNQEYITGFPSIENEIAVNTEITTANPVVRSITNQNVDAARITILVPSLTHQNMTNGDLNGSSVTLSLEYQNNSGGFIPARITIEQLSLSLRDTTATSGDVPILSTSLGISWEGIVPILLATGRSNKNPVQYCPWVVEYRQTPSGTWTEYLSGTFSGSATSKKVAVRSGDNEFYETKFYPPTGQQNITIDLPVEATYEFRVRKLVVDSTILKMTYANSQYWTPRINIVGKTTSPYQRSVRLELPRPGPWDIRLSRVTPDSTSSVLQNKTNFSSYTEIIDSKLSYPNSAIFGIQIDARQFDSIPSRAYEIYGIKVKVPSNYDPIKREYTGEWDGSFSTQWTNNPAWIFYDLVTNNRYGLGQFIDVDAVDKWALYSIGKYCDEFVPNGFGGTEPRFTCNAYLQTRTEAYNLLTQLASVFRAMVVWSNGQITAVQDKPTDVSALFTAANVLDGRFDYSGSSVKARHTVCLVTWNDPADRYRQKVEYVEDIAGIEKYGIIQTEVSAFGCTSRGQAHRLGRWILFSERLETESVTFKTGLEGALVYPGAIIHTQDQFRSGKRFGGRTFDSSVSVIKLDSEIEIESAKTYEISVVLPDGTIESKAITNAAGLTSEITLASNLSDTPVNGAMWILSASDLVPEEWRVVSISESDPGIVEIVAISSRQEKFAAVEQDLVLENNPTTTISTTQKPITNLSVTESLYLVTPSVVGNATDMSWTGDAALYLVSCAANNQNTLSAETTSPSFTFKGLQPGIYTFNVQPVNALGVRGQTSSITKEIFGLRNIPNDVTNFEISAIAGIGHITFDPSTDLDVKVGGSLKIKHSRLSPSWSDAIDIGISASGTSTSVVVPLMQGYYLAKWVDSSGVESKNATIIETTSPNIITLNFVETIAEHSNFLGAKTNTNIITYLSQNALSLDSELTIDEMTSLLDTWSEFSSLGGVSSTGSYSFYNSADLGSVFTSRLSADLQTYGYNPNDKVDNWGLLDSLGNTDGDEVTGVSARIFVRTSNDNITFTPWSPLVVGDYSARYFEFKLELTSDGVNNIAVTTCAVNIDMPDTIYSVENIVSGTSTLNVTYPSNFYVQPALGITAQNMQTGDYYTITNKTNQGFDIVFKNSAGTNISRTFDYIAKGY